MSLSEFKPLVEQIMTRSLKVGGVFISLEAVPHIDKNQLTGIQWLMQKQGPFEVLLNDDSVRHDTFTDDKMKLIVARRIK